MPHQAGLIHTCRPPYQLTPDMSGIDRDTATSIQLTPVQSGCDVRETDLPTVKRASESCDRDLYHHEHQCQHHTSEGRCLVLRHTKTKCGGMDLKIPDGWKQMLT